MSKPRLLDLFLARSTRPDEGCWAWTGAHNDLGYGQLWRGGQMVYAHRFAHEHFIGPIPLGHDVDHLCGNPGCCNPAHLEAVSHRENIPLMSPGCFHSAPAMNPHNAKGRQLIYAEFGRGDPEKVWAREMGVEWMNRHEAREAIPPAYTEFIGGQLMEHLRRRASA